MSLSKKYRVLSEKITSVEDPIELTQKGQIVETKSASTTAFIPTTITNPLLITINPNMANFPRQSASAGVKTQPYPELNTTLTPESGFKLYAAASVKGTHFLTSASVKKCYLGQMFMDSTGNLYRMKALKTALNAASNATIGAVLASETAKAAFIEPLSLNDTVNYIKVLDVTAGTTLAFNFEIKGY